MPQWQTSFLQESPCCPSLIARCQHLRDESNAVVRTDVSGRTRLLADFHVKLARLLGNEVLAQLPELAQRRSNEAQLARAVADHIAGMTDRFAILQHRALFDETPDLH